MNKCRLAGDPAALLKNKATRLTETSAVSYVEFVELNDWSGEIRFKAVGLNKFGVAVCGKRGADPSHPDHYRWGVASMRDPDGRDLSISETVAAVSEILAAPARAYDFMIW